MLLIEKLTLLAEHESRLNRLRATDRCVVFSNELGSEMMKKVFNLLSHLRKMSLVPFALGFH